MTRNTPFIAWFPVAPVLAAVLWVSPPASGASPRPADRVPPGVEAQSVLPLRGEAKSKAELDEIKILEVLPQPPFLQEGVVRAEPGGNQQDPVIEAQRAYAQARQAYRDGKGFEAIRKLMIAERRDPGSAQIARLLGQIYTESGNKVRGMTYLTKAAALDPTDLETIFLIGRFELEQSRWDTAAATFFRALQLETDEATAGDDPAVVPLLHYYLGVALHRAGYAEQAIQHYTTYLEYDRRFDRRTPRVRELAFIDQSDDQTWRSVGDLYHQLGKPDQSLAAYVRAGEDAVLDSVSLAKRRVYTLLELGKAAEAEAYVLRQVRESDGSSGSLGLVRYFLGRAESGVLTQQLVRIYEQAGRPASLALAVAEMLSAEEGNTLLLEHLGVSPGDRAVFEQLLDSIILRPAAERQRRGSVARAIEFTSQAIAKSPRHAGLYSTALIDIAGGPAEVVEAFEHVPEAQARQPAALYIHGVALRQQKQHQAAATVLEEALALDPGSSFVRLELARAYVALDRAQDAVGLLDGDWAEDDREVLVLRTRVLAQAGQIDAALALIDQAIALSPNDAHLAIGKAEILLKSGRSDEGERVLTDALNVNPTNEMLYAVLLQYYAERLEEGHTHYKQLEQELMKRLLSTIPSTRTGRLVTAELRMNAREFGQSEAILKELLREDERDVVALQMLITLYDRSQRPEKADELREQFLRSLPEGSDRSLALAVFYYNSGRADRAVDELRLALAQPDIERPDAVVARLWRYMLEIDPDAVEEAEKMIRDAAQRFPDHASDIQYERAMLYSRQGQERQAQDVMAKTLEADPNHAASANGLGYAWAVAGKNLDQAEELIGRALASEPDNAAFLDSMGWVYYKQGKFKKAVEWLSKAHDAEGGQYPVILDHLGDALYQQGRKAEAVRMWESAKSLLNLGRFEEDPETRGLMQRLEDKVQAVRKGGRPAVATSEQPVG